jgi:DNA-binding response OmpR family regulator
MTSTEKNPLARLLVIEDDQPIQELLATALKRKGYEVFAARDGAEAERVLDSVTPDLILLDLMMPRVDGWEFMKVVEGRGLKGKIPIIVISAHLRDDPESVLGQGASALLPKPFDIEQLFDLIDYLL